MRRRKATTFLPGSHINMRDEIADRPPLTTHLLFALGACLALAFLTCCTSSVGNSVTFFSDPGKYQFSSCEQLAKQRKDWSEKEQDLRLLMERAEQGTGGVVVNVMRIRPITFPQLRSARCLKTRLDPRIASGQRLGRAIPLCGEIRPGRSDAADLGASSP